jgi:hypothetical protein
MNAEKRKESFKGKSSGSSGAAGGLLANSGVQLHTGAVTMCSPTDQSWYCYLSRIIGYIGMALFFLTLLYVAYVFLGPYFSKAGKAVKKSVGFKRR